MDRLARNLKDLKEIVQELISKKAQVEFIKERLNFNGQHSASSMLILHLMGAFAEFEHAFIMERQAEGIAVAKRKGKFKGAKKKLDEEKIEILKKEIQNKKSKSQIASDLNISRPTLYKYLIELGIEE